MRRRRLGPHVPMAMDAQPSANRNVRTPHASAGSVMAIDVQSSANRNVRTPHASAGSVMAMDAQSSANPYAIRDFRLIDVIGRGAYGEVWRGQELVRGGLVAVKVLRKCDLAAVALARELEGLRNYHRAAADHASLVPVLHAGETDECVFYVMPLADPFVDSRDPTPTAYRPFTLSAYSEPEGFIHNPI